MALLYLELLVLAVSTFLFKIRAYLQTFLRLIWVHWLFFWYAGFHLDKNNILKEMKKLPMMHDIEYVDYIQDNVLDDIPEEGIGSDTLVMP